MYIVVGIGNPGKQYENTRHNIGFISVDYLAAKYNIKINKIKHKSIYGEGIIAGEKVMLVKPQTFVNLSGECVREILEYYKEDSNKLIVIYDDVSMDVGRIRIRTKGSAGGHNGLKSIIYQLNTDVFPRIKIGIGEKPQGYDLADWVLGKFTKEDVAVLSKTIEEVAEIVPVMIKDGTEKAMNSYNQNKG